MLDRFFSFIYISRLSKSSYQKIQLYYLGILFASYFLMFISYSGIISSLSGSSDNTHAGGFLNFIFLFIALPFILGWFFIPAKVKRLHDLSKSGWLVIINFVPIIGTLYINFLCFSENGIQGQNQYGPDPLSPKEESVPIKQ